MSQITNARATAGVANTTHALTPRSGASLAPSRSMLLSHSTAVLLAILPLVGACAGTQSVSKPSVPVVAASEQKHLSEDQARVLILDLFRKGKTEDILGLLHSSAYWVVHFLRDIFFQKNCVLFSPKNDISPFIPRLEEMASSSSTEWNTRLMAVKTLAAYYAAHLELEKLRELRGQPGKLGQYVYIGLYDAGFDAVQADAFLYP